MSGCDREERTWLESRRQVDTSWVLISWCFQKEFANAVEKELGQRDRLTTEDR